MSNSLLKYSQTDALDVVVMPEMIFSGYSFINKEDIKPYLEVCKEGPIFKFL